jgi:hypothetical protein
LHRNPERPQEEDLGDDLYPSVSENWEFRSDQTPAICKLFCSFGAKFDRRELNWQIPQLGFSWSGGF